MSIRKGDFFNVSESEIISLSSIEEIGAITWNRVYRMFKSLKDFIEAPSREYRGVLTKRQLEALKRRDNQPGLPSYIGLIKITDSTYPKLLKEIPDPPLWLFAVGDTGVLNNNSLSVVGSRKHTAYAIQAINSLLNRRLIKNVTIVSGLAYGIDKLAHEKSLEFNGKTVAVLAGGLDNIYPSSHKNLAQKIVKMGGALISEYPPGSPSIAYKFPIRNRIVSGISMATIIVEAAIKSGTMTTAKSVLEQNRELFAIPGDINKKTSEGCNYLIAQGATPLIYREQLLNFYGIKNMAEGFDQSDEADVNLLSQCSSGTVFAQIVERGSAVTIDQLTKTTGQSVEAILQDLTMLELAGKIYQEKPGYYKLNNNG